jgi:hypothetical protein
MAYEPWLARCKRQAWLHMGMAAVVALFVMWADWQLADATSLAQASTMLDDLLPWILAAIAAWYLSASLAWISMLRFPDWWFERWARSQGMEVQ